MWCSIKRRLHQIVSGPISISTVVINPTISYFVHNLGVIVDQDFTVSSHVGKLTDICFYLLRRIKHVRKSLTTESLTTDAAKTLVNILVMSGVDLRNLVLAGQPACLLNQLSAVSP